MLITGQITKMITEYQSPVRYYLNFSNQFVDVNALINKTIKFKHIGYECLNCHLNKPIFSMGYCKNCFFTVPQASPSIINPELSKAHLGEEDRDLEWEKKFQLQEHVVYLANSGGLKVGVTRANQFITRWIDQGASQASIFAKTENRYEAGELEVILKQHLSDKTNYRRMLKNESPSMDLMAEKEKYISLIPDDLRHKCTPDEPVCEIKYPVEEYPKKVKSISLAKVPEFEKVLKGIRGQYFIFEDSSVMNIRSQAGYVVELYV